MGCSYDKYDEQANPPLLADYKAPQLQEHETVHVLAHFYYHDMPAKSIKKLLNKNPTW